MNQKFQFPLLESKYFCIISVYACTLVVPLKRSGESNTLLK